MTAADFRRLALSLPETEEHAHMNHPDFRVAGKIFATLGYPNASRGMVKLFPDQQAEFVAADPKSFGTRTCPTRPPPTTAWWSRSRR